MEHYFTNNNNLKSELRIIKYKDLIFYSDNGVFSKEHIDYGSELLLLTFLDNHHENNVSILDLGCGYGFIGVSLAKNRDAKVLMVDINERAVHLAQRNIKENKVSAQALVSDGFTNINNKFNFIVTNPPIRVGKELLLKLLMDSAEHLEDNGELWYVIRKDQGAKSVIKCLENVYESLIVEKSKGFYIICSKKR